MDMEPEAIRRGRVQRWFVDEAFWKDVVNRTIAGMAVALLLLLMRMVWLWSLPPIHRVLIDLKTNPPALSTVVGAISIALGGGLTGGSVLSVVVMLIKEQRAKRRQSKSKANDFVEPVPMKHLFAVVDDYDSILRALAASEPTTIATAPSPDSRQRMRA
jgi:hypothetical protein